jgi:hypothetical protein
MLDVKVGRPLRAGGLSLFPLLGRGPTVPYLPGPEAFARGLVEAIEVGEGVVNQLLIRSRAEVPAIGALGKAGASWRFGMQYSSPLRQSAGTPVGGAISRRPFIRALRRAPEPDSRPRQLLR